MRKAFLAILCATALVFVVGCDGDGNGGSDGGGSTSNISGTWVGSGTTGNDKHQMSINMTLNIQNEGALIAGSYDISRPNRDMSGSLTGTLSGSSFTMTMGLHGWADGTVSGNTMTINWTEERGGDPFFSTLGLVKQ
jgi:hypothetical protein